MASLAMTSSFLGGSLSKLPSPTTTGSRRVMMVKASSTKVNKIEREEATNKRRNLVLAAAAAAAWTFAKVAVADEDKVKPGSLEAKKKYAPVCVTNPTARICRN